MHSYQSMISGIMDAPYIIEERVLAGWNTLDATAAAAANKIATRTVAEELALQTAEEQTANATGVSGLLTHLVDKYLEEIRTNEHVPTPALCRLGIAQMLASFKSKHFSSP